jgi:bifunctional non-homologous end joining protein LigD
MTLAKYKAKRNFRKSPEPVGGKADNNKKLRFVIQKHAASHLHYDFRLELNGVLKSWAVPKGPSTDPAIKRLAMMVEDHPYDYRNFEGIIPSGYGAGTVMVWDEGFYQPSDKHTGDKKNLEKILSSELKAGKLTFKLFGHKLKGDYALIKAHGRGDNSWLLFKIKDEFSNKADISLKNKSVITKKTLKQIEKDSVNFEDAKRVSASKVSKKKSPSIAKLNPINSTRNNYNISKKVKTPSSARKSKFPTTIKPMLALLVDKPFDQEGWLYEVKWDGYRCIAFLNKNKVELKSRNNKSFNEKFYPVTKALRELGLNAILDGEIVVINEKGISSFSELQNWRSEADGELFYYVFDIVWLDHYDYSEVPLIQRKEILDKLIPDSGIIKMSKSFDTPGIQFFESAKKLGLEGIMAKKANSIYRPGERSGDWLKIKANKRQEMVIGGYTKNKGTRKTFSSLLVGVFENGKLSYTGKIGTGFNDKTQKELLRLFKPLTIKVSPFEQLPDINKPSRFRPDPPHATATWLKPVLVCEVSFTEMTQDGVMRHPSFEGMRNDKNAKTVVMEKAISTEKEKTGAKMLRKKLNIVPPGKKERKTLLNDTDETQVKKINKHELKFTNLSKLYWPKEKISKRDLLNYYYQVSPYILPYLKNRPQSMNRHPNGITGESFYFKDITGKAPDWIETFLYHSKADDRDRNYLVAKNEASLLYMASLGCIEMNPWHSRVDTEDYPDWCVIDLDPGRNSFEQVIEAALATKEVLDKMGVIAFPKTSGSTGIHIYIPLGAAYTYDQSKEFARIIARLVHDLVPSFTSLERTVKDRKGKMYIDFLQNRPQATVCAPYSLRPKPGATVSMPLHWEEVKKGLQMADFTIFNALERIRLKGDLFKPVLGKGINLSKILKTIKINK